MTERVAAIAGTASQALYFIRFVFNLSISKGA